MKLLKTIPLICLIVGMGLILMADDCDPPASNQQADSGVHKASVKVATGTDGLTAEQRNIAERLKEDNKPGAIKHLYVISPFSGQTILYSTVKGKVTSGGKRLSPTTVAVASGQYHATYGYDFQGKETGEVLQDDGTYGSSGEYLYWWDIRGAYHQLYLTGGPIIVISDQPLPIKSVTINIEEKH